MFASLMKTLNKGTANLTRKAAFSQLNAYKKKTLGKVTTMTNKVGNRLTTLKNRLNPVGMLNAYKSPRLKKVGGLKTRRAH